MLREKFAEKKRNRRLAIETIKVADQKANDPRPYAQFSIGNVNLNGLLDTGASVSILGKGCRELIEKLKLCISPIFSVITTANGQEQRLLGKITTNVTYGEKTNMLTFYLCPDLEQSAYLGIDFWKSFQLAPEIIGVTEINIEKVANDLHSENHRIDPHELDTHQQSQLDNVIKMFPTFENVHTVRETYDKVSRRSRTSER